ncbi:MULTISPECIES: hypothetical protein [unclassified Actinomyces]|uniref:hypothetical protein n=1 Tax=unclassified Actinomyces TaxID=2609248 RepID=UPI001FEFCC26|nr:MULTISPECIES: hypothetical protein [unclassified Actinomyces]
MDERARQGAERLRRAAARTGGALSQAAGRAAEQAGAWGRAAEQAGQAASQVAGQVVGQAARAADAARSALPGGIRSGQEFEGTLFQRRLATALATRPHARSLGTNILGASSLLRTGLSLGWRRKRTLEREGFDTTVAPGGVLDADELIHVHGRRLPSIMRSTNLGFLTRRRQDKELRPMDGGSTTGSLSRVTVPEADRRRGAVDWDRLCVDTSSDRADDDQHIDVLVAPIGRDGAEYAADMRLLLPAWLPPRAAQALVARPDRPIVRLHLLGEGWVGVDDGARFRLYEGVPHAMRGSLVMTSGRATRAELWISDRKNIGPDVIDFLGEVLGDLIELSAL